MVRFAQHALDSGRPATSGTWMVGLVWLLMQASGLALAQTAPPAKTDGSSDEIKTPYLDNYTPSEEVKRRAMGPLRIIKQMGDQRRSPAPAPAPTPAVVPPPAPVSPAPVAAPKPRVEEAKVEKKAPAVVEVPVAPAPVAVAVPAPAPVAAPVAPPPEPPKVAKQVNTELIPIQQEPPVFNRNFMRDNPRALIKVAFDVNPDGSTSDVEVTASNNRRLNSSAVAAVAKWKFKPIDEAVRVEIELAFSLE
ncbi:MAG: energy transducer TonB [Rhodoferax sp.]|nr:energy transducer TonB [Rhodoferax sp.]